jgi:hypothetical protein
MSADGVIDRDGAELKVGDRVMVECKVVELRPRVPYGDLVLHTLKPLRPGIEESALWLNGCQVRLLPAVVPVEAGSLPERVAPG